MNLNKKTYTIKAKEILIKKSKILGTFFLVSKGQSFEGIIKRI